MEQQGWTSKETTYVLHFQHECPTLIPCQNILRWLFLKMSIQKVILKARINTLRVVRNRFRVLVVRSLTMSHFNTARPHQSRKWKQNANPSPDGSVIEADDVVVDNALPEFRTRATKRVIVKRHHHRGPTYRPAHIALSSPHHHCTLSRTMRMKMLRIANPHWATQRRHFVLRRRRSVSLLVQASKQLTYLLPRSQSLLTVIQKMRPQLESDTKWQQGIERSLISQKWTQFSMRLQECCPQVETPDILCWCLPYLHQIGQPSLQSL